MDWIALQYSPGLNRFPINGESRQGTANRLCAPAVTASDIAKRAPRSPRVVSTASICISICIPQICDFLIDRHTGKGANSMVSRLVIAMAGVLASMLSLDALAAFGRTAGTFAVSQKGSAQYAIPIWTPPGVRGVQPNLALLYDSQSSYGFMGPGWNLSGLSTISRCNRTYAQDGTPAPVTLTYTDAFCLDGSRLRLTSSETFPRMARRVPPIRLRLQIFSNVIASSTPAGNGPSYFTVKGKNGWTYEYGNTTDSKFLPAVGAAYAVCVGLR